EVVSINLDKNELLLGGSIPGCRNGILYLKATGDFEIKKEAVAVPEVLVVEEPAVVIEKNEETKE
ncbi:MAG: hypothetical protein UT02_C0069G0001, partial [Parcubacteria group bacterium GW2011_GWC2_38_7]